MDFSADSFIKACREGGPRVEAWLRGFDRLHAASLYREAAASLGCWQQAQDVVQEGMIKVWLRCATFTGPAHPIGWIRTIVRNTLLDHLERRKPDVPLHDDEGALTAEAEAAVVGLSMASHSTPEAVLGRGELERVFQRCFERFQTQFPAHAQVLRWVVEEGLSNTEIEELLGRSPGATREFISQCRKKARPFFAPWYALVSPAASA